MRHNVTPSLRCSPELRGLGSGHKKGRRPARTVTGCTAPLSAEDATTGGSVTAMRFVPAVRQRLRALAGLFVTTFRAASSIANDAVQALSPKHPAQVIVLGFAAAIAVGTGLLMLPVAKQGAGGASALEALFTATSSVCVTGLITVDTPVFWSGFGHLVILALIQIGGFGVMSFSTLLGVLMALPQTKRRATTRNSFV